MAYGIPEQFSFWGNVDYPTNADAKAARDAKYRELTRDPAYATRRIRRGMHANQVRKYAGLGQPDGRCGNVYYVEVR